MIFGIVTYNFAYSSGMDKVCISTTDIQPAAIHCYSKAQILELIAATHNGLKAIYEAALSYFPKESR